MKKALGINISTKFVYTAIVEQTKKAYRLSDFFPVRIPYILPTSARLHYIRTFILDIIYTSEINFIAIRMADRQSSRISYERIETEGVLNELSIQAPTEYSLAGTLKDFAEILGIRDNINNYIDGKIDYLAIKNWYLCPNTETKEAVIGARAVFNKYL